MTSSRFEGGAEKLNQEKGAAGAHSIVLGAVSSFFGLRSLLRLNKARGRDQAWRIKPDAAMEMRVSAVERLLKP